jgi:hypothetical protein
MCLSQIINVIGLVINAFGAALLIFFPFPGGDLKVSKTGDLPIVLTGGSLPEKQRTANKRKYNKHWWRSNAGVVCFLVGFFLQLVGTICK